MSKYSRRPVGRAVSEHARDNATSGYVRVMFLGDDRRPTTCSARVGGLGKTCIANMAV
jgi:hypothetical protein